MPSNADPLTLCEYYVERLSEKCILIPGAEDVCRNLSKYASLYIITNGLTRVQTSRFSRSPISKYFKDAFISESMGATKPERVYFDIALERAGITSEDERRRVLVVAIRSQAILPVAMVPVLTRAGIIRTVRSQGM